MTPSTKSPHEYPPRGLRADAAARYLGISTTKFHEKVRAGELPRPRRLDGCRIWDRRALDEAFDALPADGADESNPWDEVLT